mmetsp:Transcript_98728/g.294832  ORF Transcript_98728/g.294832 Transcript_98728/m.294832 type:complete len:253 (-) Transcript_98728:321-1079(-)
MLALPRLLPLLARTGGVGGPPRPCRAGSVGHARVAHGGPAGEGQPHHREAVVRVDVEVPVPQEVLHSVALEDAEAEAVRLRLPRLPGLVHRQGRDEPDLAVRALTGARLGDHGAREHRHLAAPGDRELRVAEAVLLVPALLQRRPRERGLAVGRAARVLPRGRLGPLRQLLGAHHLRPPEARGGVRRHVVVAAALDGVVEAPGLPEELGGARARAVGLRDAPEDVGVAPHVPEVPLGLDVDEDELRQERVGV